MPFLDTTIVVVVLIFIALLVWKMVTGQSIPEIIREIKDAVTEVKK